MNLLPGSRLRRALGEPLGLHGKVTETVTQLFLTVVAVVVAISLPVVLPPHLRSGAILCLVGLVGVWTFVELVVVLRGRAHRT